MKNVKIFYSWQSDLSHDHAQPIREVLRNAYSEVEGKFPDVTVIGDEATRGVPGSPAIAETIFQKITECDIFIADLTTINASAPTGQRKVPNPNVAIELGFAIANVGWDRIIILFNKACGNFPNDLPFDVQHRRITDFKIVNKSDNSGKGQLRSQLVAAISSVISANPLRPSELRTLSPDEIKRRSDERNLKMALETIHLPFMDDFIETIPTSFNQRVLHFWEGFNGIVTSSSFHLYDEKAKELIFNLHKHWKETLSYSHRYYHNPYGDIYKYGSTFSFDKDQEAADFAKLEIEKLELAKSFKEFLEYIRSNYVQIDISATSHAAAQEYINYYKEKIKEAEGDT